jgi:hypothetical protein
MSRFDAHARLVRLVSNSQSGDKSLPDIPSHVQSLDAFLAAVPAWRDPTQYTVFFRDVVPGCGVQRVQMSGKCFMHGPAAVLHYAICQATRVSNHNMVDLTDFTLRHMSAAEVWKLVDNNGGGNSIRFLARLAGLDVDHDVLTMIPRDLAVSGSAATVVHYLNAYGPALISSFRSYTDFKKRDTHSHIGGDSSEPTGSHAMAVVGWRTDTARGRPRLLVQNWWPKKQFFECDIAYLLSRRAHLSWIIKDVIALPVVYSWTDLPYAEFDLDGEDMDVEEETQ